MKKIFIYISLVFIFASCEKVITVDLDEAEPQIVVDALLTQDTNSMGTAFVRLTKSTSFYSPSMPDPIKNAKIKIIGPGGFIYPFREIGNGIYMSIAGDTMKMGNEYKLVIETEGKTLTATSTVSRRVEIDSLSHGPFSFGPHDRPGEVVSCFFKDPPGEKNYYYLKYYINGTVQYGYYMGRDDGLDGNNLEFIFYNNPLTETCDVKVELFTLDEFAFDYFKVLYDNSPHGGPANAAPGNPVSNIKGGAIGIFRAAFVSRDTIHVLVNNP